MWQKVIFNVLILKWRVQSFLAHLAQYAGVFSRNLHIRSFLSVTDAKTCLAYESNAAPFFCRGNTSLRPPFRSVVSFLITFIDIATAIQLWLKKIFKIRWRRTIRPCCVFCSPLKLTLLFFDRVWNVTPFWNLLIKFFKQILKCGDMTFQTRSKNKRVT